MASPIPTDSGCLGQNPKLPSTFTDKPPANIQTNTNKILTDNLTALHRAREVFVANENSEKIRRALNHNVGNSGNVKYITIDSIYFKEANERHWRGPGKVFGQDGQQVLVKYGNTQMCVHPCRVALIRTT